MEKDDKNISLSTSDGKDFGILTLRPKTYKTKSQGWYIWGKVVVEGKKCQMSGNIVIIGSKKVE